jgi:hypothetical protein
MTLTSDNPQPGNGYPPPPYGYPPSYPAPRHHNRTTLTVVSVAGALAVLASVGYVTAQTGGTDTNAVARAAASIPSTPPATAPGRWPADLTPFSALIGTGPTSANAWNAARCAPTSLGATGELHTVACLEPAGTTAFVTSLETASDVTSLISGDLQSGGTQSAWTFHGQTLGTAVTSSTNGDSTIATTFNKHPTILITLMGSQPSAVQTDWQSAPLPH